MEQPVLISVIIPAYNAEKYLDRAVRSVLCQMDGSIELILVNDGSTDGTGAMCDGYGEKYPNIRVLHNTNGGSSKARNAGIHAAKGEYLMFLDADDYFEPNACGAVCKVIQAHHPDIIDFGWRYVSNGEAMEPAFHKLPKNTLLGERELRELILPPLLNLRNDPDHFIYDFVWNKVFRADIIFENGVCFDEKRRTWEDRPFVVEFLRHCKNYFAMSKCFYNYVDVPGSLSRKFSMEFFRIIVENYQLYRKLFCSEYDFDTEYVNSYWCRAIENMIFRSLEQTENTDQIWDNILHILERPEVVHWYGHRTAGDAFEKEVSAKVAAGQTETVLRLYEKKLRQKQKAQRWADVVGSIKSGVRRIIRGK